CLYINKQANAGPYLERRKVQQLPERFGPEKPSAVLQQAIQACIDCAHQQKLVFSLVKQGYGGELVSVSASFDGKQHLRSLPVVNSVGYVLRFLAKLCRSLLCDDLFSHQPFPGTPSASEKAQEREEGRMESVSASFDGKQHLRSLPVVNSVGYVLRFLAKLCRSLLCDDLFSHQPFPGTPSASEKAQEREEGRMESGRPYLRWAGEVTGSWQSWLRLRGPWTVPTPGSSKKWSLQLLSTNIQALRLVVIEFRLHHI
ncbi:Hypothetical predicted protein, partial [Marmota monax]